MTTITKVQSAQPAGDYNPTKVDEVKQAADFRIMQVAPAYIRWADGLGEIVTASKLKRLKNKFTWATDF